VLDAKNNITFTAADCAYAAPDRVSCDVKVALKNGSILQLTRVWVPEGTFQSNPLTRQFGKAPADSNFNRVVLFAKTGVPEILRTAVQKVQVVGRETRERTNVKGKDFDTHAWFAGFGPVDKPAMVVVVFVENGGHGNLAAAPLAKALFETRYGIAPAPPKSPKPPKPADLPGVTRAGLKTAEAREARP